MHAALLLRMNPKTIRPINTERKVLTAGEEFVGQRTGVLEESPVHNGLLIFNNFVGSSASYRKSSLAEKQLEFFGILFLLDNPELILTQTLHKL